MNTPLPPVAPVSPIISIQPVVAAISGREAALAGNPLLNLPAGTLVEGFVINRDAQSNPILRTRLGDLRVTSEVFLKTGSEVVFRVDTTQSSLARIVTVDGLSPQDYSAAAQRGLTEDTVSTTALQAPPAAPQGVLGKLAGAPANAPILQAIILQGQPQPPPASLLTSALAAAQSGPTLLLAQLSQLRAGTPLRLALLDIQLPAAPIALASLPASSKLSALLPQSPAQANASPAPILAGAMMTESTPAPSVQTAPQQQVGTAMPALPPALSGTTRPLLATASNALPTTTLATAINAQPTVAPPSLPQSPTIASDASTFVATATPPALAPHASNQLVANVIGHDADGANILHTPFASLKVYTAQPLPTGTTLLVQAELPAHPLQAAPEPSAPAPTSPLKGELTSFGDAMVWLAANHPDLAREVQQRIPNMSHKLASSLLFFVASIKNGEASEIFGKRALRQLQLDAPEIFARLRQDMSQMQTALVDAPMQHWNMLPLPMLFGQELVQARVFFSKEPPEREKSAGAEACGQRFILEVSMSALGAMQFDGFVREREKNKSFDLMVRADTPLPEDVTQGIRSIFETSLQAAGLHGQVVFQHGAQHFVHPQGQAPQQQVGDGTHTILA